MIFVLNKKRIISGVITFVFAVVLCVVTMGGNAYSRVCFLPDDSDCADGTTSNFWPGSSGGNSNDGTTCDASYNSRKSVNECGASCVRCVDGGKYNGLYKCPANTCNCNGYNSIESVNACGDACELCTIAGDRNYGKYKCPPATNPCNQCEEECKFEEADTAAQLASDPCMECEPCNNQYCTGKWRCAINQACKTCRVNHPLTKAEADAIYAASAHPAGGPNCYTKECNACGGANAQNEQAEWYECHKLTAKCSDDHTTTNGTLSDWEKTNHCYSQCDICYDDAHYTKWHCDCLGYDTQTCGTNQSPIEPGCTGHGGKWYSGCCNNCNGCRDNDITDAAKGWSCTRVENACTGGNTGTSTQYNCLCSPTCGNTFGSADATKQASDAWKEDTCSDCDGTHYKYSCAGGYHADGNGGCAENCNVTCTAVTVPQNATCTQTCQALNSDCTNNGDEVCTAWSCNEGYHSDGNGGCTQDCNVTCTAVTVPQNATCTQTCQAKNADCTNNGDEVCTAWSCNEGYHSDGNGGCTQNCNVTCTAVTVPQNATCTQTCQAKNADCTNNGDAVCTAWECDEGYKKNGNTCVANAGGCPTGYAEKPADMTDIEYVFYWVWYNDDYWAQECDPEYNNEDELQDYCPYTLSYAGQNGSNGLPCVKIIDATLCPSGYHKLAAGKSETDYLLSWITANVSGPAAQDCDPDYSQDLEIVCRYKLTSSDAVSDEFSCVKVIERTCTERGLHETEEACHNRTGRTCRDDGTGCYIIKPDSGGSGSSGGGYYCDCPIGWNPGPCDGSVGHGSDGNRCDCCINCAYPGIQTMYPSSFTNSCYSH